jgi:hypothetical protein
MFISGTGEKLFSGVNDNWTTAKNLSPVLIFVTDFQ